MQEKSFRKVLFSISQLHKVDQEINTTLGTLHSRTFSKVERVLNRF